MHMSIPTSYLPLHSSYEYGPCVGVSRLERWERANILGLNPPVAVCHDVVLNLTLFDCLLKVREILSTRQGSEDVSYSQSVFTGEV
jgi:DNA polymerase delta subunit 4